MTLSIQADGLGARLKSERKRLGLNQDQLCELTSITRGSLSRYERGVLNPGVDFLIRLEALKFDVCYVLHGARIDTVLDLSAPTILSDAIDMVDELAIRHDFKPPPAFRVKAILWIHRWLKEGGDRGSPPTLQELLTLVGRI